VVGPLYPGMWTMSGNGPSSGTASLVAKTSSWRASSIRSRTSARPSGGIRNSMGQMFFSRFIMIVSRSGDGGAKSVSVACVW